MKITIQDEKMFYSCDYSVLNKNNGGFLEEYFPSVSEAVNDALDLLACIYDRKSIAEYLLTDIPTKDYAKKSEDGNNQ